MTPHLQNTTLAGFGRTEVGQMAGDGALLIVDDDRAADELKEWLSSD